MREGDGLDRVADLLAGHDVDAVPVLDDAGTVIGMFSDCDLFRYRTTTPGGATGNAGAAMSHLVASVPPDADVAEVAETMLRHRIHEVPVIEGDHLVGIVGRHDLLGLLTINDVNIRRETQRRLDGCAGGHRWAVQVSERVVYVTGDFHDEVERHTVTALAATVPGVRDVLLRSVRGERSDCG